MPIPFYEGYIAGYSRVPSSSGPSYMPWRAAYEAWYAGHREGGQDRSLAKIKPSALQKVV